MSNSVTPGQRDRVRRRLNFDEDQPKRSAATAPENLSEIQLIDIPDQETNKNGIEEVNIVDLSNMTPQQKHEQMMKWNFDFDNEVPLEGQWEWKREQPPRSVEHKEKVCALGKDETKDRNV